MLRAAPSTAIVLFARAPEREAKQLGLGALAERRVHASLVQRTLNLVVRVPDTDVVAALDGEFPCERATHVVEQRGHRFEDRLLHVLRRTRALGYGRIVVVGSDTPSMSAEDLRIAATSTDVVVGPSTDGGIYLLGFDADDVDLLDGLPWQTDAVLRSLRARFAHAAVTLLAAKSDVDDPRDTYHAHRQLAHEVRAALGVALDNLPTGVCWRSPRAPISVEHLHLGDTSAPRGPPTACVTCQ